MKTYLQTVRSNIAKGQIVSRKVLNCPSETSLRNATIYPVVFERNIKKVQANRSHLMKSRNQCCLSFFLQLIYIYPVTPVSHRIILHLEDQEQENQVLGIALCYAMC